LLGDRNVGGVHSIVVLFVIKLRDGKLSGIIQWQTFDYQ